MTAKKKPKPARKPKGRRKRGSGRVENPKKGPVGKPFGTA